MFGGTEVAFHVASMNTPSDLVLNYPHISIVNIKSNIYEIGSTMFKTAFDNYFDMNRIESLQNIEIHNI